MGGSVKFGCFTVSNRRYFTGTVLLFNSLRLTNPEAELVVLDRGLTEDQRKRLAALTRVVDHNLDENRMNDWLRSNATYYLKPYPAFLDTDGIAIAIDSDMIVTDRLDDAVFSAANGKISAWPDGSRDRWFAEWQDIFGLDRVPRKQVYVNGGFVAVSTQQWPRFFSDWWNLGTRVDAFHEAVRFHDQDALNALLATEVPRDALAVLPLERLGKASDRVTVRDPASLRCFKGDTPTLLLHYNARPKPWLGQAWSDLRGTAFAELMPRLLFGSDVALPLSPREVPVWVRPSSTGRLVSAGLTRLNKLGKSVKRSLL